MTLAVQADSVSEKNRGMWCLRNNQLTAFHFEANKRIVCTISIELECLSSPLHASQRSFNMILHNIREKLRNLPVTCNIFWILGHQNQLGGSINYDGWLNVTCYYLVLANEA